MASPSKRMCRAAEARTADADRIGLAWKFRMTTVPACRHVGCAALASGQADDMSAGKSGTSEVGMGAVSEGPMASHIESDGNTVTVTTDEGHRIGFAMAELNAASTAGEITTDWSGGVPPDNVERCVRAAKAEAEAHVAQHQPEKPEAARAARDADRGVVGALKDTFGLT